MSIGDTNFGVQVGIGVIGRVLMMAVAFLGAVVLARLLGPEGYGSFYLLMAIVSFLDNPITGWATACRKRLTEHSFPSGEAVGSTLIGLFLSGILVTVSAWIGRSYLRNFVTVDDAWLLLSILFIGMAVYVSGIELLKTTANFGLTNWVMAGRDTIRVCGQVTLVVLGFGVVGMVSGMVLANLLVLPVVLYLLGERIVVPSRETLKSVWTFARSSIPNGIVGTAQSKMDIMLLGAFVGPGVVGNYEVAMRLTLPAMFIAGVASGGLMGRISNRQSKDQGVGDDIRHNISYASLVSIPLFFGAIGIGTPVIVTIFSSQYVDAGSFVVGLALYRVFKSQKVILSSIIDGFDRPEINFRTSTIVFVLNLVLGIGLFFMLGPIGVVIATVISEIIGYSLRAFHVRSLAPSVPLVPQALREQILSGALMLIVVIAVRQLLSLNWWGPVGLLLIVGGVMYFLTLTIISEPFRGMVRAVTRDAGLL